MWKRKAQRIENKTVRVIDKVLKDSKNITNAMAWLRRNYPEAFKKEVEQMTAAELYKRYAEALKESDKWKQPFIELTKDEEPFAEYQDLLIQMTVRNYLEANK